MSLASTSVVKEQWLYARSIGAQIVGRGLSGLSISHNLERALLSLVEAVHPGAFDRADMHEHILAAVVGLNEAEALLTIKPLDCSLHHGSDPSDTCKIKPRANAAGWFRDFGRRSSVRRAGRGEAKSFGRKLDDAYIRHYIPVRKAQMWHKWRKPRCHNPKDALTGPRTVRSRGSAPQTRAPPRG